MIPFGQPILVGHHSEKRHRGAIRRHDAGMRAGLAKLELARETALRAAGVGTGGISSDDPEAIAKLTEKRTELEIRRDWMKAANKWWKQHGSFDGSDIPQEIQEEGFRNMKFSWQKDRPFPSYSLTNIGARIRDAAKRAGRLERFQATAQDAELEIQGATITADKEDNRVTIAFEKRLSKAGYLAMRSAGFVWSPSRSGFTRKMTSITIERARALAQEILAKEV